MPNTSGESTRSRTLFFVLAAYLIASFLWRFFVPAHEYPPPWEHGLDMIIDLVFVATLIQARWKGTLFAGPDHSLIVEALFWLGLAAGIGLFLIRLGGDAQWATGHRIYYLLPR